MMTAFGSVETAVESMKAGATDFLLKPSSLDHLMQVIPGVSTFSARIRASLPSLSRRVSLVSARSKAPSGAIESSPGRKPCGTGPETRQPRRGVRKRFVPGDRSLAANGSFAPMGLLAVRFCPHGLRHGLLSSAPTGLMPMKVMSEMYKLQRSPDAGDPQGAVLPLLSISSASGGPEKKGRNLKTFSRKKVPRKLLILRRANSISDKTTRVSPKRACESRSGAVLVELSRWQGALRHRLSVRLVTLTEPRIRTGGRYSATTGGAPASGCGAGAALGVRADSAARPFPAARLTRAGCRFGCAALFGATAGFALRAAPFFTTRFGAAAGFASFAAGRDAAGFTAAAALALRTAAHRLLRAAAIRFRAL